MQVRTAFSVRIPSRVRSFLKTETKLLKVPVSSVASLSRRLRETAFGKNITVSDFAEIAFGKSSACLVPLISAENGENTIEGSAVFKNGKMTEKISNKEATGVLWLSGKTKNAVMAVPFEGKSFDIKIKNPTNRLIGLWDFFYFTFIMYSAADITASRALSYVRPPCMNAV